MQGAFTDDEIDSPVPDWIVEAEYEQSVHDLAAGATASLSVDARTAAAGLQALELLDPGALAAQRQTAPLIQGVVAAQRLIGHVQALQQQWLAALARPGVALSLAALIEACSGPGNRLSQPFVIPEVLPADLPHDDGGHTDLRPLLERPVWSEGLAVSAARVAAAEVGCALKVSPVTARTRTEKALSLVDGLPRTLAAQQAGTLDGYRVSIIADETTCLTPAQRRRVEDAVLPHAHHGTPAKLRRLVKRAVIAVDADAAERRSKDAHSGRGVQVEPADDGMGIFRAMINAVDARIAYGVLDGVAASLCAGGQADGRGSSQLRADVFSDIFRALATTGSVHLDTGRSADVESHGGSGHEGGGVGAANSADPLAPSIVPAMLGRTGVVAGHKSCGESRRLRSSPPVCLNVYVDAETLAGFDRQPAELEGYGPITAELARAIAASADSVRALVANPARSDGGGPREGPPRSGSRPGHRAREWPGVHSASPARAYVCSSAFDAGRTVYRPPASTSNFVQARDRHCQFPGCRVPARRCDIDHRQSFESGGATCPCNLDVLCRFHHRLKTFTPWRPEPGPDGCLIWTSPLGSTYSARLDDDGSGTGVGDVDRSPLPEVSTR